jgi:ribosomal protein L37AE/L43A
MSDRSGYWERVMDRYYKRHAEKTEQERRQIILDRQYGKGRGIRRQDPQTCTCGGRLKHVNGDVWKCEKCGKTVVTAPFKTLEKLCDLTYADEKEVLNLDGAVVFKSGSKSGKRRKKPKSKLHDYFEI